MGIYIEAALELIKQGTGRRSRLEKNKAKAQSERETRDAKEAPKEAPKPEVAPKPKPKAIVRGQKEMAEDAAAAKANMPKSFREGIGETKPKGHATQKADFNFNIDTKDRDRKSVV